MRRAYQPLRGRPALRAGSLAILVAGALGLVACSRTPRPRPAPVAMGARAAAPEWLPRYTPAQEALLRPVDVPIQVQATRVFPDLRRFGYADDRRLEDPRDTMKFTRLVAGVITDSPRFYALDEAPAELANHAAQYGPAGPVEADGWHVVRRDAEGVGELVPADLAPAARADFERGAALYAKRDLAGAVLAFRAAVEKSPRVPGLGLSLGEALVASGDAAGAREAFHATLAVDPTFSSAHRALAELAIQGGDLGTARRSSAEALAYHPSSKRALAVADQATLGGASSGKGRVRPFAIFLDVDSVGAVHVASPPGNPIKMYAGCRAVLRYEPDLRAELFHQPKGTPYFLSVLEEVLCLESAIGAYLFDRVRTESSEADPAMDALLELAQEDGLSGYVMFEILGPHRPERARMAPAALHEAVVRYVERHVLAASADSPAGTYTAGLGSW